MAETTNYNLFLTDNDTMYFNEWREKINGKDASNMVKIDAALGEKVDKIDGKNLSTNDYTMEEKEKLSSIAIGATNYVHPDNATTRHVSDGEKLAWNGKENSFTKNDAFNKSYGTTAGTTAQGNDGRFTDARPNPNALTFTGAVTGSYDGSSAKTIEIPSGGGGSIYDVVIRTQAEFDALIASPTWLGAKSVCFIGDGGTLIFNFPQNLFIPETVSNIKGINDTFITSLQQFSYLTKPTEDMTRTIENMTFVSSNILQSLGFRNFANISNCKSIVNANGGEWGISKVVGFSDCINVSNCYFKGEAIGHNNAVSSIGNEAEATGFLNCTNVVGCISMSDTKNSAYPNIGFAKSYGFYNCSMLDNCQTYGIAKGRNAEGYGVYNCSYTNGVKRIKSSSTAFLGGANTFVDTLTVG